ncbi:hypothetical protein [Feifania hominis]|uniref:DUF4203 domain-containing protein n=1 Tax=Feifania hominis TaxID=2763660 RepID=A0A926HUR6_9FIRM|nr:hypothetical protein [Feifania hominis]MBC8536210.1 hypothetical protein [Feifania hominis]
MGAVIVYLLFHFAVGSVVCFFGRRLYFPVIMTELFLISLLVALDQLGAGARGFLTGAAVGILLALLARFLYKAGVFLCGALAGLLLGGLLSALLPQGARQFTWLVILVCAVGIGVCAVLWCETFIALSTASQGAAMIAPSLCFLFVNFTGLSRYAGGDTAGTFGRLNDYLSGEFSAQNGVAIAAVFFIFLIVGFVTQQRAARHAKA